MSELQRTDSSEPSASAKSGDLVETAVGQREDGDSSYELPTGVPGFVPLSDVSEEAITWVWPGWIAIGEITDVGGDPGTNKSSMLQDIAARVTRGLPMPDGSQGRSGGAVLLSGEESLKKTLVGRLKAAGADMSRIAVVSDEVTLPEDLDVIERAIHAVEASLVIIDPLSLYLGSNVNAEQTVRRALSRIRDLAENCKVAVVVVRHLTKNTATKSLYRSAGSIAFAATARSVLLVAKHPDDPRERLFCQTKNNLCPIAPTQRFRPVPAAGGVLRIEWRGTSAMTTDDVQREESPKRRYGEGPGRSQPPKRRPVRDRFRAAGKGLLRIVQLAVLALDTAVTGTEWLFTEARKWFKKDSRKNSRRRR